MTAIDHRFGINTYSYTQTATALDCIRRFAAEGWGGIELMLYPGHLWPADLDTAERRRLRRAAEQGGLRITTINMPNIDLNIAAATREMRDYTLGILASGIGLAGELGAEAIVIGSGKANPLLPAPIDELIGHFRRGLDTLLPPARAAGVQILVENMPFGFLANAASIVDALDAYGEPDIGTLYDVANGYFIGEDLADALRRLKPRLKLMHFSDTGRAVYRHDAVGLGDVPFATLAPVLAEIGFTELPVLEIISRTADADIPRSAAALAAVGIGRPAEASVS